MRTKTRRESITFLELSWGQKCVSGNSNFSPLHTFLNDHEDTVSTGAGITNRFYKAGEFTNMESVNNEG